MRKRLKAMSMTMAMTSAHADPRIGRPLAEVDTPALLLDRAACERNLARMADFFRGRAGKASPAL